VKRYGGLSIPLGMLFAKGDRILDLPRQGEAIETTCPALDWCCWTSMATCCR